MLRTGILALLGILAFATTARAQAALGGCKIWVAEAQDKIAINQNHYKLLRDVSVECNDMQFFADEAVELGGEFGAAAEDAFDAVADEVDFFAQGVEEFGRGEHALDVWMRAENG